MDDFAVFVAVKGKDGFRGRTVSEMSNGVPHTNLVVLKQDAMGLGADGAHACKRHDVAFGHHGATDMRVEFAIIVNEGVELFFVSGGEGGFVFFEDAHDIGWEHV